MEASAAATPTFQIQSAVNVLSSFSARRRSPTFIPFPSPNPKPRHPLFHSRRCCCSTKPDVGSDTGNYAASSASSSPLSNSNTHLEPSPDSHTPSSSHGLVFHVGPTPSWDCLDIGSPVVKRYLSDDQERWYLWYHGATNAVDSIGLAISSNGIHWERGSGPARSSSDMGQVMQCSRDWWAFDTYSIRPSEVLIMSSSKVRAATAVYWLYYTGFSSEKVVQLSDASLPLRFPIQNPEKSIPTHAFFRSLPGLAISQDGRHWARIEGEHHSGALFDVGADGDWDSLFISSPQVVYHTLGDLRMYYHSFDMECQCFTIGIARSRDGIRWVKLGKIMGGGAVGSFDEAGVMNGHVVLKKDGGYVMAYEAVAADGQRSIGLVESPDGLKSWKRIHDGAVLLPLMEEDGWDNKGVGSPCLVPMDGDDEWRLYYRGMCKEGRTGIGMAVSEGGGTWSFKRWAGFHL
ncbi:uncharacterized protein LOC131242035 [Magnolia sinica]|uniref:uncharacterized protein LOC131242035 n=1 Tax=Magnolia sinica TaxID=86752 RepID=UPI002657D8B3|nr:uncharacterized protein LOC131242035 [Magnolia sinica]